MYGAPHLGQRGATGGESPPRRKNDSLQQVFDRRLWGAASAASAAEMH